MANHASSKKRIRQTEKRTLRNRMVRTRVRTHVKQVRAALQQGDAAAAKDALVTAVSAIDRAVSKGVYHRRTGSRYVSRLTAQVAKLAAA